MAYVPFARLVHVRQRSLKNNNSNNNNNIQATPFSLNMRLHKIKGNQYLYLYCHTVFTPACLNCIKTDLLSALCRAFQCIMRF